MIGATFPMPFNVQQLYRCATCKKFTSKMYVVTNQLCKHCDGKFEIIPGKKLPSKGMEIFKAYHNAEFIYESPVDYLKQYLATFIPESRIVHSLKGV